MKKNIFFFLGLVMSISVFSQVSLYNANLENIEGDTIVFTHLVDTTTSVSYPFEHKNFVKVVNETDSAIAVRVKRDEISIIQGTLDYFCWGNCYSPVLAGSRPSWLSPDFVIIDSGGTATGDNDLSIYLDANKKSGEALYKYTFIDTSDFLGVNGKSIYVKYILTYYATSIQEKEANQLAFNLYPNPANDFVNVEFEKELTENLSIEIKDILGKQVETIAVPHFAQTVRLNLSAYSSGIYFVSVLDNQRVLKTKKLILK